MWRRFFTKNLSTSKFFNFIFKFCLFCLFCSFLFVVFKVFYLCCFTTRFCLLTGPRPSQGYSEIKRVIIISKMFCFVRFLRFCYEFCFAKFLYVFRTFFSHKYNKLWFSIIFLEGGHLLWIEDSNDLTRMYLVMYAKCVLSVLVTHVVLVKHTHINLLYTSLSILTNFNNSSFPTYFYLI